DLRELRAVEPERARRGARHAQARGRWGKRQARLGARTRREGEGERGDRPATIHGKNSSDGGRYGWTSGTITPCPTAYPGGIRMGRCPAIGTRPNNASATARSDARTALHAIRNDFTVGVCSSR